MMYHLIYFPDNGHFFPCKKIFFSRDAAEQYKSVFMATIVDEFGVLSTGKNEAMYIMEYEVVHASVEQPTSELLHGNL